MYKFLSATLIVVASFFPLCVTAQSYDAGLSWLLNQQQSDGSFSSPVDISTKFQASYETALALQSPPDASGDTTLLLAYISGDLGESTEWLAKKLMLGIVTISDGGLIVEKLLERQNSDGGFGALPGYDSSVFDTAFALEILAVGGLSNAEVIARAISFVNAQQNPDGGYSLGTANESSIYITALISSALQKHQFSFNVNEKVAAATAYLLAQQMPSGGWLTAWETSLALIAIIPVTSDSTQYAAALKALESSQSADGSWDGGVYQTALALRTLSLAMNIQPPVPSTLGLFTGTVVDDVTGQAIAGIDIDASGASNLQTQTGADGSFVLPGVAPGDYVFSYSASGYIGASKSAGVSAGQRVDLGEVRLNQLADVGILSGVVTDIATGLPINGAVIETTGAQISSIGTGSDGRFFLAAPPGVISITVSAGGYDSASGVGTILAGSTLYFSPSLYTTDTTPNDPSVEIIGVVIDSISGSAIHNASVRVVNTAHQTLSDSAGIFRLSGISAGELLVEITATDYLSASASVLAPDGSTISLGQVRLARAIQLQQTTVTGFVTDSLTGAPVEGANIQIVGENIGAVSAADGSYTIGNVANLNFTISASAVGFLSNNSAVQLSGHGLATVNIQLQAAQTGDVSIVDAFVERSTYAAFEEAELHVVFHNFNVDDHEIVPYIKVVNSDGVIIEQFPGIQPANALAAAGSLLLPSGSDHELEFGWYTQSTPPGSYQLVIQAFDLTTGRLLAERGVALDVEVTQAIAGHIAFDPPIAQLAANTPVNIDAKIVNKGNVVIPQGEITATVTLKNEGYQQRKTAVELQTLVQSNGLDNPQATDIDSEGNFYVVNKDSKSVVKVTPAGQVSEFLGGLHGPTDIDVSPQGDIYVLDSNQYIIRVGVNGEQEKIETGLSGARAIEVMADGRIYIVQADSLFEIANDGTRTKVIGGGLSSPEGMVIDSQGDIFVASRGDNSISKFADGQVVTFVSGISQPYGMDIDAEDNLYVTSFGSGALYKVTPGGAVSLVADGLKGPRDVKIKASGDFIVSSQAGHEVVSITPAGEVSVLVSATIFRPAAAHYDTAGSLYVANQSFANVVKFGSDASVSVIATGVSAIDFLARANSSLTLLESSRIREQDTNGVLTQLVSGLSSATSILAAPSGNGYLVAEAGKHRITHVSDEGQLSTYSEAAFPSPVAIREDALGNQYILNYARSGTIAKISTAGEVSVFAEGLYYPRDMVLAADGGMYVTEYDHRRVIYVDAGGNASIYAELNFRPFAISLTPAGEVLVAPWGGYTVYQVDEGGVTEYASVSYPIYSGLLADFDGNVWASHTYHRTVSKIDSVGELTLFNVGRVSYALESDGLGGVYVAGAGGVSHIDNTGLASTFIEGGYLQGQTLRGLTNPQNGSLWLVNNNGVLFHIDDQGLLLNRYSSLNAPRSMTYDDNGDLLIVNANNTVVRLGQPGGLPEVIADGNYKKIRFQAPSTLLLATSTTVKTYDLLTDELSTLVSGFTNITGLALKGDGALSVVDYTKNELRSFVADGSETEHLVGLVSPGGLLLTANDQILVANSYPNAIVKIDGDGSTALFSSLSHVKYMVAEADGSLLASRSGTLVRLSSEGKQVSSYPSTGANGLLRDNSGNVLVASATLHGLLAYAADYSYQLVAAGLARPRDIETNAIGELYVADNSRGTVSLLTADKGLSLVESGLARVESISFGKNDMLFTAYGGDKIRSISLDGTRAELPVSTLLSSTVKGLATEPNGNLAGLVDRSDLLFRLLLSEQKADVVAGDVVHSVTLQAGDIAPGPEIQPFSFGAFTPIVSGDYLVELTAVDNETAGVLTNTLHVGPSAHGSIALAQSKVFPGDRLISGAMNIFGADSTGVTKIEADGTTLAAASYTNGRGIAADSSGNIYSSNTSSLVKISPVGEVSEFVGGVSLGNGLAVDNDDNIYAGSGNRILKITQNAEVKTLATLGGTVSAVAVDQAGVLYSTDSSGRLSRIYTDGTVETVTSIGLTNPAALAIDAYGYFYVLNRVYVTNTDGFRGNIIVRISPDGKSATQYYSGASFEFEGVNLTADCSNNLLFAPFYLPEIGFAGEERLIVQLVGDTGEINVVLDGTTIDPAMADMDVLFYDRLGDRLLIWTDRAGGKIFSFPVACGGLDLEAHLVTRGDVDLTSADPTPTSVVDLPDGNKEYVWLLSEVDNRGENINLNLLFKDLNDGESRPALQDAYLLFTNSFIPDENVRVPLDIPEVTASSLMNLDINLERYTYEPNDLLTITSEIGNESDLTFDGQLMLILRDGEGVELVRLPDIPVTELGGFEIRPYLSEWLSGDTHVGDYQVYAVLYDSVGRQVAEDQLAFNVVADIAGGPITAATVTTDKAIYKAWDQIRINARTRNTSVNAIMAPSLVEISISDAENAVIYTNSSPLNELFPGGLSDLPFTFTLSDGLAGEYQVSMLVRDAVTQAVLASDSVMFAVERSVEQGLSGYVTVAQTLIDIGEANQCTINITNVTAFDIPGITIYRRIYSMDTGELIDGSAWTVALAAGGSFSHTGEIVTTDYDAGAYACLLQVDIGGGLHNVAAEGFDASEQIKISGEFAQGNGARVLILTDAPELKEVSCTPLSHITLSTVFGSSVGSSVGSFIDSSVATSGELQISLLDAAQQIVDAETIVLSSFSGHHNQNAGLGGIELSVIGFTDQSLALALDGTASADGHLGDDYRITGSWTDGANALQLDTGLIHSQCHEARGVGEHFGLFRIDSLTGISAANDQHGPTGSPSETTQFNFIKQLLDESGLQYTLVTSAEAFAREFHSGGYGAYVLLSEQIKLPETLQKLVREAAYRGEGLLVAGDHDQRNHNLYDALSVIYRGKEPKADGVEFIDSEFESAHQISLQLSSKVIDIALSGATSAAHFLINGDASATVPALTYHTYGLGQAVHVGYDLLAEATLTGLGSAHAELILRAVKYVLPTTMPVQQGAVIPVVLALTNQGVATAGRAVISFSAGVSLVDSGLAIQEPEGQLVWSFSVEEQEVKSLTLWLQAETDQDINIDAQLQAGEAPDYIDLESLTYTLALLVKPSLPDALIELIALESQNNTYRKALNWLQQADSEITAANPAAAIESLIKCSDELIKVGTHEATLVRLKVDEALRLLGQEL